MKNSTEQIFNEYHSKLHGFILSKVGDSSLTDDILQDVFTKIYSRIGSLRGSSKMQSWIYRITRNVIIDHYRSHMKVEELPESLEIPDPDLGDKTRQEIEQCFLPMIKNLPERYSDALEMSAIEGLTQKEVALRQGISLSGAKSRIQRGRSMLKDMLLDCCRFELDHMGNVMGYVQKEETCDMC